MNFTFSCPEEFYKLLKKVAARFTRISDESDVTEAVAIKRCVAFVAMLQKELEQDPGAKVQVLRGDGKTIDYTQIFR